MLYQAFSAMRKSGVKERVLEHLEVIISIDFMKKLQNPCGDGLVLCILFTTNISTMSDEYFRGGPRSSCLKFVCLTMLKFEA